MQGLVSPWFDTSLSFPWQKFVLGKSGNDNMEKETTERTNNLTITMSMRSNSEDNNDQDMLAQENCAICLEKFEDGDEACTSNNQNCKHVFHHECIFEWLLKNEDCPCCRRTYLSFESIRDVEGGSFTENTDSSVMDDEL